MNHAMRWRAALPLLAALFLSSCADAPSDEQVIHEPVTLRRVDGSDLKRVIMTARAAERIGIDTAIVRRVKGRLVIPSAAVIVDPTGAFWVYTSPKPLVFVRHEINIHRERADQALLSEGPPPGTKLVTVGVPELYGAEFEVGH